MRKFLAVALVALVAGAALGAGLTFTLKPDAGVQGAVVGITQAKFPSPGVARDPIVHPYIKFTCVDFDPPTTTTAPTDQPRSATLTWRSWERIVRADMISGIEEGRDEYAGYTAIYTSSAFDINPKVEEGDLFYVRGDMKTISAIVAQVTGTKTISATFEETR